MQQIKKLRKSIIGGGCISLGSFCYLITLQKTNNPFLAAMTFYLGLSLIMIFQQDLFTGQVFSKAGLGLREYIRTLSVTWIGNLIGSIITAFLLAQIVHPDVSKLIANKLSLTLI